MTHREQEIIDWLFQYMDEKRIHHSYGVRTAAESLARHYGGDVIKAGMAGLVHDCAKRLSLKEMHKKVREYDLVLDPLTLADQALLHGPLGAEMLRRELGITDTEVLEAVACHTTGRRGMTLLDKVLCLSDYIEEGRTYPGAEAIRRAAWQDIDAALVLGFDQTIRHVLDQGGFLHPATVEARNDLLKRIQEKQSK